MLRTCHFLLQGSVTVLHLSLIISYITVENIAGKVSAILLQMSSRSLKGQIPLPHRTQFPVFAL
jgi:hypothetical protein